ncbi:MAG TPA: carboxyl transferase domain-containing protein, partial [Candidatus Limnocylindrales bacterium]|nr:carboxyl transferase domain-containing protein [Candidatus Limnocylindrales bacterium]
IGLMTRLRTPIVVAITGEGGSGGALAVAVGDVVIALENAVYSVISPEGCASILWRTADEAATAALAMRMTADEQRALGVVDLVVAEPGEGAHTDHAETARRLRSVIVEQLDALSAVPLDDLVEARYRRFRRLGSFREVEAVPPPPPARPGLADRFRNLLDPGRWSGIPSIPAGRADPRDLPARDEV